MFKSLPCIFIKRTSLFSKQSDKRCVLTKLTITDSELFSFYNTTCIMATLCNNHNNTSDNSAHAVM